MALGISWLFNIKLPINFNSPYKSQNIQDFWRRWHMTLSRFLRDYIYIPLGGNRLDEIKTYRNLFLTFFIGGIWHGAAWTFILWGTLHGIATCTQKMWQKFIIRIPQILSIIMTFMFINVTWIFFRAPSIHRAFKILKSMSGLNGFDSLVIDKMRLAFEHGNIKISLLLLIPALVLVFSPKNSNELAEELKPNWIYYTATLIMLIISITSINKVSEFLYFQF